MGRRSEETFLQRQIIHEKSSTSLIIKEIQIKTTMRFHLIHTRITKVTNAGEDVEKREPSHTVDEIVK